jgi:hypothetical protein
MNKPASVRVTIYVAVDPATAFDIFTAEIDQWYQRGPHNFFDPIRAKAIRFEPGVGGRLLEVYDDDSGDTREMARVEAWQPGVRLLLRDSRDTEIEVTFGAADAAETKVTLEHRGLERLPVAEAESHARFGGRLLIAWFSEYLMERTTT